MLMIDNHSVNIKIFMGIVPNQIPMFCVCVLCSDCSMTNYIVIPTKQSQNIYLF